MTEIILTVTFKAHAAGRTEADTLTMTASSSEAVQQMAQANHTTMVMMAVETVRQLAAQISEEAEDAADPNDPDSWLIRCLECGQHITQDASTGEWYHLETRQYLHAAIPED